MVCSLAQLAFLYAWCHLEWVGPSYINHQSRQSLTDMVEGQSDLGNSSFEGRSSQVILGCIESKINNRTHPLFHTGTGNHF